MNPSPDFAARLEHVLAALTNRTASAAELGAAAETTRAIVRDIDAENESAPQRKAGVLAAMAPQPIGPGIPPARGKSISETTAALWEFRNDADQRTLLREIAASLAAQFDARVHAAQAAEVARDAARSPLRAQTERVDNLAKRFAEFPTYAKRIVDMFRDDALISRLGENAYSHLPRPRGNHVAIELSFSVPRVLATDHVLAVTKLPGHWPPGWRDSSILEQQHFEEDDSEIVRPLSALCRKGPTSEEEVDRAIARAQSQVLAMYRKTAAAIEDLLVLDATITVADRESKYPDHEYVFDQAKFPQYWLVGRMKNHVALPAIGSLMLAAE